MYYQVARNYDEYLQICKDTRYKKTAENCYGTKCTPFSDTSKWEEFFDVELKANEHGVYLESVKEYSGDIPMKPKKSEYPVLVCYKFEKSFDRWGDLSVQIWDWIPLKKLGVSI